VCVCVCVGVCVPSIVAATLKLLFLGIPVAVCVFTSAVCTLPLSLHNQESNNGFYALVEGLLDDVFRFGSLMPRVASHLDQPDYLTDVEEIEDLSDMREDVLTRVSSAITQVCT